MSERIEVGDLVMVVRTCCSVSATQGGGLVFRVAAIEDYGPWRCVHCWSRGSGPFAQPEHPIGDIGYVAVAFLKRIPPLTEPESINEEMTA